MLPMLEPSGSMLIVYVPVVGKVWVERLKLLLQEKEEVSEVLSGFNKRTVTQLMVLLVTRTVACCPDVPLNVSRAF